MNLFFDKRCPICNRGITHTLISLNCEANKCYRYSRLAHYATFLIGKDMLLHYTQFPEGHKTDLFIFNKEEGKFKQALEMNLHFELNFNDLQVSIKRLKNLLIFS